MLLTGLLLVIPGVVIPVYSQFFVDYILARGNTKWTTYFLLIMLFTVAFQAFFTWLRSKLLNRLQLKMALVSGNKFLHHMLSLPIDFFAQRYSGDLAQRVEDNNVLNNFLTGDLAEAILNMIVAAFYLILLLIYSRTLTVIGLTGCLVSLALSLILGHCRALQDPAARRSTPRRRCAG